MQLEIDERNVAGTQKTAIDRTEVDHHAVMGLRSRVGEFEGPALVETEIAKAPGREDELTGKTEIVERPGPVLASERAMCFVVLAQQHIAVGA